MSKKSYDSVQYVGQEVQNAINRMIEEKTGGSKRVFHTYSPSNKTSFISYSLFGIKVEIALSDRARGYNLKIEIGDEGGALEKIVDKKISPKRSKPGRISPVFSKGLAEKSFQALKDYYLRREGSKQ